MTRYKVAKTDEFDSDGARVLVEVDGLEIAVFRIDGKYHALANYCVHQGGPLCEGKLTGKMSVGDDGVSWEYEEDERYVVCPWHEWKFDVTTGRNVSDERYVVPNLEVTVEDEDIYITR